MADNTSMLLGRKQDSSCIRMFPAAVMNNSLYYPHHFHGVILIITAVMICLSGRCGIFCLLYLLLQAYIKQTGFYECTPYIYHYKFHGLSPLSHQHIRDSGYKPRKRP